ncbi:MAG TPA: hypothetical protein VFU76_06405 [Terriglobales bacterium]|nr:hypothetical protein [Terriglobales bacterium]
MAAIVTFFILVVLIPTFAIRKAIRQRQQRQAGTPATDADARGPVWVVLVPPLGAALSFLALHLKQIGVCIVPQVSFGPHMHTGHPNVLCDTLVWVGLVSPWFIGAGFAFTAVSKTRSLAVRTVGGIELVLSMFYGWFWLVVTTGVLYLG